METPLTNENLLLADVDRLREQFPQTQDLYREVCTEMFFRYGMTPTANKLYQLVRKGSMSAPAEALNKFWKDLREKSRVRIEHPDLPDALKTAAGELTATLWLAAQAQSDATLASYRSEAQALVAEAKTALATTESERDMARQEQEKAHLILDQANSRIGTLEQHVAAARATNAALESQLQEAKLDNTTHQQRLEDARREFTAELDKLRAATQLAEERFLAAGTRALLEIDHERTAAAKLQKELDAVRTSATQAAERHRSDMASLQVELGDYRQKTGILEGNLQAVMANLDKAISEIKTVQAQLADAAKQVYLAGTETKNWRRQAEESQRMLAELRKLAKPLRISSKSKAS